MTEAEQIEAAKSALAAGDYPRSMLLIRQAAPALVRRVQELEDWQEKALPYLRTYHAFYWLTPNKDLSALIAQAEGSR
jgi:hypothetical protein